MARRWMLPLALVLGLAGLQPAAAEPADPPVDPGLFQALEWRNVGPYRGGRVTAVAGVPAQPFTFYSGAAGGGVWKTEDGGTTWRNVSDGFFKTGSVGALAVADSDPNVVYAGMGEAPFRGVASSHGDGVYRSTDAGRSWTHLGLAETRQISRVAVHPQDPDRVWVAAQGNPWTPNPERGVYRSTDGGHSWQQVLHVSDRAGASDLAMDPTNPRILFAAFWEHQRLPWKITSGGPGSGLYKSTDGGDSWEPSEAGLPETMGKIGVALSPANPDRVWALVEAEQGGLFRSDDGGATWTRVNDQRSLRDRAWYYTHVIADPQDPDTVYVPIRPAIMKSTDGGCSFTPITGPHGDYHALWINPDNNRWMIFGDDGGAAVSYTGGETWSTLFNQPTAQFYRVAVDNRFFYRLYGGQQDNTSLAIASRTPWGGIGSDDWYETAGCESAHVALDPDHPRLVYGTCVQGMIDEYDLETETHRPIKAYPSFDMGGTPEDFKYRFNWNAPVLVSVHDPEVVYHAGNVLLRTADRGLTWTEISPDLTRDETDKQGPGGGPFTNEGGGGEVYNTLLSVAESPHDAATLWTGSDDGLVHLTRDGGQSWHQVTPPGIGAAMINAIEVSPHEPAVAYLAVTRYKLGDLTPLIFVTADYGQSWERRVAGIDEEAFVRVVREDPVRRGLLYAGTETGVWVSFDDGRRWQPLQRNLPVVPVTDLRVHRGDLVASTQGRGFWILDDLSPLREIGDEVEGAAAHLYTPRDVYRVNWGNPFLRRGPIAPNPPAGAVVYYSLASDSAEPEGEKPVLKIEILDAESAVVRTYSSQAKPAAGPSAPSLLPPPPPVVLATTAGLNRVVWDLRREGLTGLPDTSALARIPGPVVPPGRYQARLTLGERVEVRGFEVLADPRRTISAAEWAEHEALVGAVAETLDDVHRSVIRCREVRGQVEDLTARIADDPAAEAVATAGRALVERIDGWQERVIQPQQKLDSDVIAFENRLNAQLLALLGELGPPVTAGARHRWADLAAEWETSKAVWDEILREAVPAFNALVRDHNIPAVRQYSPDDLHVVVDESRIFTEDREVFGDRPGDDQTIERISVVEWQSNH